MHEIAAADLACPIESLTTKELSSRDGGSYLSESFEISGCGKTEILLMGAAPWRRREREVFRAVDDMRA
jgi:hypothetical protein